ncbi:methyl-accepting chemotaxis protein [Pseudobutyrivibrio sp.]|uniref:methyl-accepting chemotaxis protein n=1 Tax=Pseudobutyrivibrio sp. TaxID=2014367 RepID=UPI0025CF5B79|nr:methyl-accepting chemotaxis protein [Pseudobutyrivibrio sp.]MBR5648662.1 methyl-accepting chemotaxis protein [Pseudobutyrivibrio sp.]
MGKAEMKEELQNKIDEKFSEEQKENIKAVANVVKKNKGNFFQTISFQNGLIYGLIIVAFLIFAYIWYSGMTNVVSVASGGSVAETDLLYEMSVLKTDAVHMTAEINRYMGSLEGGQSVSASDFAMFDAYNEEMLQKLEYVAGNEMLQVQCATGVEDTGALNDAVTAYSGYAIQMRDNIIAGDIMGAVQLIGGDYGVSIDTMNEALAKCDEDILWMGHNFAPYLEGQKQQAIGRAFIVLGFVLAFVIVGFIISFVRINKVILNISYELQAFINNINKGRGDLTTRINTKTKTELALVTDCINQFIETLQGIIKDVKDGSNVLTSSSDSVMLKIQSASDNVTNTSAAMEELAASMENVASTTGTLTDNLDAVREATKAIDAEAIEGAEKANQIKDEADLIKREANSKKESTGAKMEELAKVLEESVKESEQVNQIGDLTNEILDIASQTNLLALNASIEAARAGEAGKGFAVVADEISSLAANSRDTAGNIQEISSRVTAAVKTLSDNAIQVIDFINENVLSDYDSFVETGVKYENTATMIDEMLVNFRDRADNLNTVMNEMATRIETISSSVSESSEAINLSASAATEIVGEIQGINNAMDQNNDVTKQLNASTQKFEIV